VTYRGFPFTARFPPSFSLGSHMTPQLWWIYSSLKERSVYVRWQWVDFLSSHTFLGWGWFFLTYTSCDKILALFPGRFLNPFQYHTNIWKVYAKSFIYVFPRKSILGKLPSQLWWTSYKFIWWLHWGRYRLQFWWALSFSDNSIKVSFHITGPWNLGICMKYIPPLISRVFLGIKIINPKEWNKNCPKFNGDPTLAVNHVVNYMKYVSIINVLYMMIC
jgi:hypothetical protein